MASRIILPINAWPLVGFFEYGSWQENAFQQISHLDTPLPFEVGGLLRNTSITSAALANSWLRIIQTRIVRALPAALSPTRISGTQIVPRNYAFNAGCYVFQFNEAFTERYLQRDIEELRNVTPNRLRGLFVIQIARSEVGIGEESDWQRLISINLIVFLRNETELDGRPDQFYVYKLIPDEEPSIANARWHRRMELRGIPHAGSSINELFQYTMSALLKETLQNRQPGDLQSMFLKAVRCGALLARILTIEYRSWVLTHPRRHLNALQREQHAESLEKIESDIAQMHVALSFLNIFIETFADNDHGDRLRQIGNLNRTVRSVLIRATVLSLLRFDYGIDIRFR